MHQPLSAPASTVEGKASAGQGGLSGRCHLLGEQHQAQGRPGFTSAEATKSPHNTFTINASSNWQTPAMKHHLSKLSTNPNIKNKFILINLRV